MSSGRKAEKPQGSQEGKIKDQGSLHQGGVKSSKRKQHKKREAESLYLYKNVKRCCHT